MANTLGFDFVPSDDILAEETPLLDAIDELRKTRTETNIDFPMWVVVGDQNTGKSSVVDAITGIPFPVRSGVCTRFPIQFELRRTMDREETAGNIEVEVAILPSPGEELPSSLGAFKETTSDMSKLPELVEKASKLKGMLSDPKVDGTVDSFTTKTLQICAKGPKLPCLSVVDLPGIYNSANREQNEAGIQLVKDITLRYAHNENSIILLIVAVDGRGESVNHTTPGLLKGIKGIEKRTLGVLTGLDKVGEKTYVTQIINNKTSPIEVHWQCLRNLSAKERETVFPPGADLSARQKRRNEIEEEFFNKNDWNFIPDDQKGIVSLRKKLQLMLRDAIRQRSGPVTQKLTSWRDKMQQELDNMNKALAEQKDPEEYLMDMADKFVQTVQDAVRGEYAGRPFFGKLHDSDPHHRARRLRGHIRELNRTFAWAMKSRGKTDMIRLMENTDGVSGQLNEGAEKLPKISFLSKEVINAYFACEKSNEVSKAEYEIKIKEKRPEWHGLQHPQDDNPAIISLIFEAQSVKWKELAETHIEQVWEAAKTFVASALEEAVPDGIRQKLTESFVNDKLENLKHGMNEKLKEILKVHSRANPGIFDTYEILQGHTLEDSTQSQNIQDVLATVTEILGLLVSPLSAEQLLLGRGSRNEPINFPMEVIKKNVAAHFTKVADRLKLIPEKLASSSEDQSPATTVEKSEGYYKVGSDHDPGTGRYSQGNRKV